MVGAVVLPDDFDLPGLNDSKKLTKKRRETLEPLIQASALGYGLGWVHAEELDEVGMSEALRRATRRAVEQVQVPYHDIIIDGTINFLADTSKGAYVTTLPKADALIPSVSAASVLAKVARDRFMTHQDALYPGYNFAGHAGYGTAAHRAAIDTLGVSPLHRLSFAPLVKYAQPAATTTKSIGDDAEQVAVTYLEAQGHEIMERNWRTRVCEVDIISQKDGRWYIVEVKHRKNETQGGGIAAITPQKYAKLHLGATMYTSRFGLTDQPILIAIITTKGLVPVFEQYLELE